MPVVSVDLAYKRYEDIGVVTLLSKQSGIQVTSVDLSRRLNGSPSIDALANSLVEIATQIEASWIFIDGPQAWKALDNGCEHARVCEQKLGTQGKTGLPGKCKPANYVPFTSFAIALFDALAIRGWPRLSDPATIHCGEQYALESFPTAAWRSLGEKPLGGSNSCDAGDVAKKLESLRARYPLQVLSVLTHHQVQALVAGLAGAGLEGARELGFELVGIAPVRIDGTWREGFIVVPTRTSAEETQEPPKAQRVSQAVPSESLIARLGHRFSDALTGAARLHAAQLRKGTDVPYVAHLLGVAGIALDFGATEDEAIAAILHDVIEDVPDSLGADWARRWIRFQFGEHVLEIVEGCTDADVKPKPAWLERKMKYVQHLGSASSSVVLVSASDKLHNARAILTDYRELGDGLFARFNREAGKHGTVGYYRGLVRAFQKTGHHLRLVRELEIVVTQIEAATGLKGVWPPRTRIR